MLRYAIQLTDLYEAGAKSSFSNISVHSGYNTAWGLHFTSGSTLQHSAIYKTITHAVRLEDDSFDNWVVGNVVMLVIHPGTHRDTREELERFFMWAAFASTS